MVPDKDLLSKMAEVQQIIASSLADADQKSSEAAQLRACADEFEDDAAALRKVAVKYQAFTLRLNKIRRRSN